MHAMSIGSELLAKLEQETEAAQAKAKKAELLKTLSDFITLHPNRTATIRLSGADTQRLLELIGDKHTALTQKLTGRNALINEITLLAPEAEFLHRVVVNS